MARCIVCAVISFGLVQIPIKLFTAAASEQISFNMISPDGNRVEQQYVDKVTGEVVPRDKCDKGYEHSKGQFVVFTADEMKALEAERSQLMEIKEFVPLETVDLLQVEKSYYLGPDLGGDKGYVLLTKVLEKSGQVAVATYNARGKEQLVLIRPYNGGLVLHQMFYANEVRDFDEILETCAAYEPTPAEVELAGRLIDQLANPVFVADKYEDGYAQRVKAAVDKKLAGKAVVAVGDAPNGKPLVDIFEALRLSLAEPVKKLPAEVPSKAKPAKAKPAKAKPAVTPKKPRGGAKTTNA